MNPKTGIHITKLDSNRRHHGDNWIPSPLHRKPVLKSMSNMYIFTNECICVYCSRRVGDPPRSCQPWRALRGARRYWREGDPWPLLCTSSPTRRRSRPRTAPAEARPTQSWLLLRRWRRRQMRRRRRRSRAGPLKPQAPRSRPPLHRRPCTPAAHAVRRRIATVPCLARPRRSASAETRRRGERSATSTASSEVELRGVRRLDAIPRTLQATSPASWAGSYAGAARRERRDVSFSRALQGTRP